MQIGLDLVASLRERHGNDQEAPQSGVGLEWPVLRARLAAAHAARRELLRVASLTSAPAGGFANWQGIGMGNENLPSHAVNPTDLGDGKVTAGKNGVTAAPQPVGG